jgi:hypothetical protein
MSSPGLFARIASQGKWKPARHLVELDIALVDAIEAARAGKIVGLDREHAAAARQARTVQQVPAGCTSAFAISAQYSKASIRESGGICANVRDRWINR